jgi:hypothetical protein
MMPDDPAVAAETAAAAAAVAGTAAEVAAEAAKDAAEQPALDSNAVIAAEVAIASEEEATERARIAGRTEIKIAELQQEEPSWLNDIRACLTRLETMVAEAMAASRPSSTPQPSVAVITDSPTIVEGENNAASEAGLAAAETEPEAAVEPEAVMEPPAQPARPARRWI